MVELKCYRKDGSLKWATNWIDNLTTSAGKAQFALLAGAAGTPFTYLALGTSSGAVTVGQTALLAEITTLGIGRAAATVSRVTTTVTNDTLQLYKFWTVSGGSVTIEEIGYFNASSAGVMGGRALTGTKLVNDGETVAATYKAQFL